MASAIDVRRVKELIVTDVRVGDPITLDGNNGTGIEPFPIITYRIATSRGDGLANPTADGCAYVSDDGSHNCSNDERY